jgi:hypothetical protein
MQIASHVLILLVRALRQHADFAARSRWLCRQGCPLQSGRTRVRGEARDRSGQSILIFLTNERFSTVGGYCGKHDSRRRAFQTPRA